MHQGFSCLTAALLASAIDRWEKMDLIYLPLLCRYCKQIERGWLIYGPLSGKFMRQNAVHGRIVIDSRANMLFGEAAAICNRVPQFSQTCPMRILGQVLASKMIV